MSKVTSELKAQHVKIVGLLNEAKSLGLVSEKGRQKLLEGKNLILEHLKKEDAELYPRLAQSEATKKLSASYSDEMKGLVMVASQLFSAVEAGKKDIDTATLLGKVYSALTIRISREETELYPAFDKLVP